MADKDTRIGAALAAATCRLLGTATPASRIAAESQRHVGRRIRVPLLRRERRARAGREPECHATRDFGDERKLGLDLSLDSLTGASPSGAIATDSAQTFTSPSGRGTYSTPAGVVPLDNTFP